MQRAMLQVAWAVICFLPTSDKFHHRHHEPERVLTDFDNIIARTALNFTANFLLACPEDFFNSEALLNAVNCNSRDTALKAAKGMLDLLRDWEPLGHLYSVDAFRQSLVARMEDPIKYWMDKIEDLMVSKLAVKWPSQKNALKHAFSKLQQAINSPDLVRSCIMKIANILIVMVKRPKELFHAEPWMALYDPLINHIKKSVDIDVQLAERIKEKRFRSEEVPSRMVVEIGKVTESDMAMIPLMSPKIFENLSEPVKVMLRNFDKSYVTSILQKVAERPGDDR